MAVRVGKKGTPIAPACSASASVKFVILKTRSWVPGLPGFSTSVARRKLYADPIITLPTQAATTSSTQPEPIIWSNKMSEIGPISVSPRFFCRMISCPAANGIICSSCKPIATLAPSGTNSAIAACMERTLDTDLSLREVRLFLRGDLAFDVSCFAFEPPNQVNARSVAYVRIHPILASVNGAPGLGGKVEQNGHRFGKYLNHYDEKENT